MTKSSANNKQLSRFEQAFDAFIRDFDLVFDVAAGIEGRALTADAFERALKDLEVNASDWQPTPTLRELVRGWKVFCRPSRMKPPLEQRLDDSLGEVAGRVRAKLSSGRLGLWRLEADRDAWTAHAVDGRDPTQEFRLAAVVDEVWEDVEPGEYMGGWLVDLDVEGGETEPKAALLFSAWPDREAVEKLEAAAARGAWGRGGAFRRTDYQEDVLALLVNCECFDTERDDARVFLTHHVVDYWQISSVGLHGRVCQWMQSRGLDPIKMRAPEGPGFRDPRAMPGVSGHTPSYWSTELAQAAAERPDELRELLRHYRVCAVPMRLYARVPMGERCASFLLPDDELFATVHLDERGRLTHPTAERWANYRLSVLDLDSSFARRVGLDENWTIGQALAWGRTYLAGEDFETLAAIARKHRRAMFWVAVVNLNFEQKNVSGNQDRRPFAIQYEALLAGIRTLLPAWVAQLPVTAVEDPGRGTWSRVEQGIRQPHPWSDPPVQLADDEPLRLGTLPEADYELKLLRRVGKTTVENIRSALYHFVRQWPESCGHRPVGADTESAAQASAKLDEGLDELDELF